MKTLAELHIELQDTEWQHTYTDHDREIVRAIAFDADGYFYFVRVDRDDEFGKAKLIETAGGGVEAGENLRGALKRELLEELGADAEILCRIGIVRDYYNLIHRHNINHYFLCRIRSLGETHLTEQEAECFHLSVLKLRYEEAAAAYEACAQTKLGRLLRSRELPVLKRAKELLDLNSISD